MSEERQLPRGRATRPRHPGRPCLNCGDPTPGEYCPSCGQRKVDVQVSVRAMVADLLEDELLLGRRLPHTLLALLFRPGMLTDEVLHGRIVRYVRPLKLYLVSSVVFFLVLSFVGLRLIETVGVDPEITIDGESVDDQDPAVLLATIDSALAAMQEELSQSGVPEAAGAQLTRQLLQRQRAGLLARLDSAEVGGTPTDSAADTAGADGASVPAASLPTDDGCFSVDNLRVNLGHPRVESVVRARLTRLAGMECRDALQEVARTFLGYIPTAMFALLPLFALVLKLLYVRQGRFYAEHMIFLLHVHAFVFAIFTILLVREWLFGWAGALLGWAGLVPTVVGLLLLWALVYIYLAMKRVYGQGWGWTLVKYWTLGWAYFWVLAISVPVLLVATLLLLPA